MTIKKVGSKYQLVSSTGKNLGTFPTEAAAKKREAQVQGFKKAKKADGTPLTVEDAQAVKDSFLQDSTHRFDMRDADQREQASCMYIAMDEIQRHDVLMQRARAESKSLEQIMAEANPQLDDGTSLDLASGAATTEMLVIERARAGETGAMDVIQRTGYTNEHDHGYDPSIAGFTSPDADDGHVHWVDIRMQSTRQGGAAHHIHSTNPMQMVMNSDPIDLDSEDDATENRQRIDPLGFSMDGRDSGGATSEFDGFGGPQFDGVERGAYKGNKDKTKKDDEPARRSVIPSSRHQGNPLDRLVSRTGMEKAQRADKPKKRRTTGQERLFGKLDPDSQDVALLPPDDQ